jgi:regulator of replication initiation timing
MYKLLIIMVESNDYEIDIEYLLYKKYEYETELKRIDKTIRNLEENQKLKIENKKLREEISLKSSTNENSRKRTKYNNNDNTVPDINNN